MGRSKNGGKHNNGVARRNDGGRSTSAARSVTTPSSSSSSPSSSSSSSSSVPPASSRGRFSIRLTFLFLLVAFSMSTVAAFFIGWVARLVLLSHMGLTPYDQDQPRDRDIDNNALAMVALPTSTGGGGGGMSKKRLDYNYNNHHYPVATLSLSGKRTAATVQLPSPKVMEGKDVPFTTYASKTFQMAGAATSNTLHIDRSGVLLMGKSRKEFDGGPDFTDLTDDDNDDNDDGAGSTDSTDNADNSDSDGNGWVPCDETTCSRGKDVEKSSGSQSTHAKSTHNSDSDGLHLPAGQHLLVDVKDVDPSFLDSEERLARAMIELIEESRLTLLSYHCHSLVPIGVSCAGVLLESHVAFHTWPAEGVVVLDLFTCGGGLLVPTLPSIERLFGVKRPPNLSEGEDPKDVPKPALLWSHKLRGFREGFAPGYVRSKNPLDGSLGRHVLGKLDFDLKRPLLSTQTKVQSVEIYEVMEPKVRSYDSYRNSLIQATSSTDTDTEPTYESSRPESFGPDRMLFLDDAVQSTLYGDAACHESIVHPAMIAHPNPKRVAIVGGGEGATLREALKHRSVQEALVLEVDRELVNICREFMPEWSDCSDLDLDLDFNSTSDHNDNDPLPFTGWCFDDRRAQVVYEDAVEWFLHRFGKASRGETKIDSEKFDVIIMDTLEPKTSVETATDGSPYDRDSFVESIFDGLSPDGVFVVQLGNSKMSTDPPDEIGRYKDRALMIRALERAGFESIHTYDEGHAHFYMPWSYLVAFKQYESRARWQRTVPQIEIELQKRLVKTKSGRPVLRHFDATTMIGYQMPPKAQETVYCRREEYPYECNEFVGYDGVPNLPAAEYLKVEKSTLGEFAGRGLFAAKDLPAYSALALEGSGRSIHFPPSTWSVMEELYEWADDDKKREEVPFVEDELSSVLAYAEGYGFGAILLGEMHMSVESNIMLFMNHGCNGTFTYGNEEEQLTELSVDLEDVTGISKKFINKADIPYSPVFDRNWRHALNSGDYTLRDIKAGEEIFTNYLSFVGDIESFTEELMSLREQCAGEGVGRITKYESESS